MPDFPAAHASGGAGALKLQAERVICLGLRELLELALHRSHCPSGKSILCFNAGTDDEEIGLMPVFPLMVRHLQTCDPQDHFHIVPADECRLSCSNAISSDRSGR